MFPASVTIIRTEFIITGIDHQISDIPTLINRWSLRFFSLPSLDLDIEDLGFFLSFVLQEGQRSSNKPITLNLCQNVQRLQKAWVSNVLGINQYLTTFRCPRSDIHYLLLEFIVWNCISDLFNPSKTVDMHSPAMTTMHFINLSKILQLFPAEVAVLKSPESHSGFLVWNM